MTFPPINPKPTERTVNFMMLMLLLMMLMMRTMRMMLVTWTLARCTPYPSSSVHTFPNHALRSL